MGEEFLFEGFEEGDGVYANVEDVFDPEIGAAVEVDAGGVILGGDRVF